MKHISTSLLALAFFSGCTLLPPASEETKPAETPRETVSSEVPATVTVAPGVEMSLGGEDRIKAQTTAEKIATESAKINAFFEDKFNEAIARSPMSQTYLGIKNDYDKWDDASEANEIKEMKFLRAEVKQMRERFDPDFLDAQAALSYRLKAFQLEQAERDFKYRQNVMVFSQMRGAHASIPAFLINQHRITDLSDAEAYIARLNGIPEYLGANQARAKKAADTGILAPRFVYGYVIESIDNILKGYPFTEDKEAPSPLYGDFTGKIAQLDLTEEEAKALTLRARTALLEAVLPAYQSLLADLKIYQDKAGEEDGVWRLPDGEAFYAAMLNNMTTTDMTADEIHDLGLAEMDRIQAEMGVIKDRVGFDGSLQDFFEFMRTDPQFYKPETEAGKAEYLAEATAIIENMQADLPLMFNTFPKAELIVKAVEPFREKAAGKAFYQSPARDGSRPGIYYANLYQMSSMPTYQMEALAYHEGIPGHHMQRAIAQELEGLPEFRKYVRVTAYTEGWGLYSEYLPKELGYYEDPYSDFGRLAMELWRAARLVVDTGLHSKQWSREKATQYLIENTPNPERDCIKAIDRYIVMPGQATAYKIGMIKLLKLREQAKAALGDAFSLGEYHDVVLRDGPVPLSILEENINAWIAGEDQPAE